MHINTMKILVEKLIYMKLRFGQDWGGMIGLRVVAEMPDRFARVVVSNTGMVARDGITAWLYENFIKFMVWWNGAVTFEELKTAADKALMLEEPSALEGIRMFSNGLHSLLK